MANLYHTKLLPTSITVTSAQTGYGADNLFLESIARNWRATATTQQDIEFNYAVGQTVQALLAHDLNFDSAEVWVKVGAGAYANVGTLNAYKNKEGRRRGLYVIGGTANVTGIRLRILNGAAADGLAYKRVGSLLVFSGAIALPPGPTWGYNANWRIPRVSSQIVNGQRPRADVGVAHHLINCSIEPYTTEDWQPAIAALQAGTCALSMGLGAPRQWQIWPVTLENDEINDVSAGPANSRFDLVLREAIA